MTILLKIQLSLAVVGAALIAAFSGSNAALSFSAGSVLTLFNLSVLVFGWPRLLAQKQVARAVAAIIFKLAILGWILYLIAQSQVIHLGWFAVGLSTVIPSVLVTSFNMPTEI